MLLCSEVMNFIYSNTANIPHYYPSHLNAPPPHAGELVDCRKTHSPSTWHSSDTDRQASDQTEYH